MNDLFAYIAFAFSLAGNVPYVFETVKGDVKPERISWLLWTMLGATYFFGAVFSDGAVWFTAGELIGPVIILALSIKYGVGGKSRFDLASLLVALFAFAFLFVVESVLLSIILALIVDGIGMTLTIKKLILDPSSESRAVWALWLVSAIFAILSLETLSAETLAFPIYVLLASTTILLIANPKKEQNIDKLEKL